MNIKKVVLILFFFGIFFEFISFVFSYYNLLPINSTPKLYSQSTYDKFRNEKNIWGAWHNENLKIRHKTDCFDAIYNTNNIGAKDYDFEIKKNNKKRFILLGDSFAEGYGVNNNFTFKSYLEKSLNSEIYNFGSAGAFGPLQYYLVYENLAKKYEHDAIIISLLPANDFKENDYALWKEKKWNLIHDVERYRPYYIKKNSGFDYFIPKNAKKRDNWYFLNDPNLIQKIKKIISNNFWSFNIYKSFYFLNNYKETSGKKYSGYFDATLEQQESAIYFISKILRSKKFDNATIVIFPSKEDLNRIYKEGKNINDQRWYKDLKKLNEILDYKINLVNIADYVKSAEEYSQYLFSCDNHLSRKGNKFAATKIYQEMIN